VAATSFATRAAVGQEAGGQDEQPGLGVDVTGFATLHGRSVSCEHLGAPRRFNRHPGGTRKRQWPLGQRLLAHPTTLTSRTCRVVPCACAHPREVSRGVPGAAFHLGPSSPCTCRPPGYGMGASAACSRRRASGPWRTATPERPGPSRRSRRRRSCRPRCQRATASSDRHRQSRENRVLRPARDWRRQRLALTRRRSRARHSHLACAAAAPTRRPFRRCRRRLQSHWTTSRGLDPMAVAAAAWSRSLPARAQRTPRRWRLPALEPAGRRTVHSCRRRSTCPYPRQHARAERPRSAHPSSDRSGRELEEWRRLDARR